MPATDCCPLQRWKGWVVPYDRFNSASRQNIRSFTKSEWSLHQNLLGRIRNLAYAGTSKQTELLNQSALIYECGLDGVDVRRKDEDMDGRSTASFRRFGNGERGSGSTLLSKEDQSYHGDACEKASMPRRWLIFILVNCQLNPEQE